MTTSSRPVTTGAPAIEDIYPLTGLQQGLLFHSLLEPGSGMYYVQNGWSFTGHFDQAAFVRAWELVFARHPVLRSGVVHEGVEVPVSVVSRSVRLPLEVLDWRSLDRPAQATALDLFLEQDRRRGADFDQPTLVRITLIRLDDQVHQMVWSFHHLVLDGWSVTVVLGELLAAYRAYRVGRQPELAPCRPYRDFVAWLGRQDAGAAESYWRARLADRDPDPTPLVVDRPTGDQGRDSHNVGFSPAVTETLTAFAHDHHLTLNTVVQAAWALLLARYNGEDDVVFGVTTAGRPEEILGVESMVGLFINTTPARVTVEPDRPLVDWLQHVQAEQVQARAYEHTPLVQIQAWSEAAPGGPLFETLFVFENYPTDELDAEMNTSESNGELLVADDLVQERGNYPLCLLAGCGAVLAVGFEFDRARFDRPAIERLAEHLVTLLEAIAVDPGRRVGELPIMRPHERQRLLVEWNDTEVARSGSANVPGLVADQARRRPEASALTCGQTSLTYGELDARVNQLAHHLRERGVGAEVVVGVGLARGTDAVVSLLAVLRAGGAYLPLDPDHPVERLGSMLADSRAAVLVCGSALAAALTDHLDGDGPATVCLDQPATAAAITAAPTGAPDGVLIRGEQLAYVVYTSGSTGRPKGVMVSHRSLLNLLESQRHDFGLGPDDVALQFAPFGFDVATCELLTPLLSGARVVVADRAARLSSDALEALLVAQAVSFAQIPPAAAQPLSSTALAGLRAMVTGGEAFTAEQAQRWASGRPLFNAYGPTETTVTAAMARWDPARGGPPSIGGPIANTRLYVLDSQLAPVPVGVPGELFIGGVGVARGYAGRPDLTAERFVADPFALDGGRLYRTGDRVRWGADGQLDFLGRVDHQLKLRGHRIEPGEVEAALLAHPDIAAAVVVTRDRRLVAYLVPSASGALPSTSDLRAGLAETLPDFMVPAVFVELDRLPLSPNGKVDRAALPAVDGIRPRLASGFVAPRTPTEELLAGAWAGLLGLDEVGVDDGFFDLGGHSLLATQVVSRLRTVFGVELTLAELFDHPTVAGMAEVIEAASRSVSTLPIMAVDRDGGVPLSFAQQRLWFLDQLEPGSVDYLVPAAWRLEGPLDVAALGAALDAIVERHEVLRTRLVAQDGVAVQVVDPPRGFGLEIVDLSRQPDALDRAEELVRQAVDVPFDLATGPLVRGELIRVGPEDHVLSVVLHHAVADEWSADVFQRELAVLYRAFRAGEPARLAPLGIQYADFAVWQREWLQGEVLEQQLAYWCDRLADAPLLELPTDRPRPAVRTSAAALVEVTIPAAVATELRELARSNGATLYMTLLAGLSVVLGRHADQDDVVVGSAVANRNRAEIEDLIGFFINTLVMRTDLSGDPTFAELLAQVRRGALGAYAHQDLPFEQLVDVIQPERDRSRSPLFQVVFNFAHGGGGEWDLEGLRVSGLGGSEVTTKFDLTFALADEPDGSLGGIVAYSTDLFDAVTVQRLVGHLGNLLADVAADPGRRLSQLRLLDESELPRFEPKVLVSGALGSNLGVHTSVSAWAADHPAAPAVVFGGQTLSYADLDTRASRLARYLQAQGVGPEVVVGLALERGIDHVVAVLGILKAGGAYLPLDPDHPAERLGWMLADSRASVLLGHSDTLDLLPQPRTRMLALDDPSVAAAVAGSPEDAPDTPVHSGQLAYLMYTSGSTGRPKGVLVSHCGLRAYVDAVIDRLGFEPGRTYGLLQSPAVDFGNTMLFGSLVVGGTLHVLGAELATAPRDLAAYLDEQPLDYLKLVPSHLAALAADVGLAALLPSRTLVLGGEAAPMAWARQLLDEAGGRTVFNHYGPTETTVGVTTCPVTPDLVDAAGDGAGAVPIGQPLGTTRTYVLDRRMAPQPVGGPGELYVGGPGVARGYTGDPALTAARFVADPFATDGSRVYRTGDRAAGRSDDGLRFLGRVDDQLKVRGYRVEPGEVEAALAAHPAVGTSVVAVPLAGDGGEGDGGEPRLVAYVVPDGAAGEMPAADELRHFLAGRLPAHMVPAVFVELAQLPLRPNGKVDRAALPAPGGQRPTLSARFSAARTPTEEVLAGLWADVLGVERVGVDDDFFDLGGHSLLATQVVSRLRGVFGVELALAELFDHPTVAGLAVVIDGTARGGGLPPIAAREPVEGPLPLSFAQQRLWFLDQLEPGSTDYVVPLAMRFVGPLDGDALHRALAEIVERHEVLRTRLVAVDGVGFQVVDPPGGFELTVVDLEGEADAVARAEELVAEDAATPFDLAAGPLFRGRLLRLGAEDHVVSLVLHHVVSDEWSVGVLHRELEALYAAFCQGGPSPLAPLTVQYADFAVWQREVLPGEVLAGQLAYWRERLAGAPVSALPTDRPRPPARSSAGGVVEFVVPPETVAGLRALCREVGASLYMTLLAGFDVLLGRYASQDDVVVGTLIANRNRAEIEGLIGFFVNTLVLRTDLSGDPSFAELVARVRQEALGAYAHQDLPFEQLVDDLTPERDRSRTPLFQVLFDYAQSQTETPSAPLGPDRSQFGSEDRGLEVVGLGGSAEVALYDLTLAMADDGDGGLGGALQYSAELFDRSSVERLAGHLVGVLAAVAADPGQHLSDLSLLDPDQRRQVVADWNDTAVALDPVRLAELVADQAAAQPDGLAVVLTVEAGAELDPPGPFGARHGRGAPSVTYGELDRRADQLAQVLLARGVGPESVVGVCLPRGTDVVVALLGVLRVGGAYLLLDPDYPSQRLGFMVTDSGAEVVVGQGPAPEDLAVLGAGGAGWLDLRGPEVIEAGVLGEEVPDSGSSRSKNAGTTHPDQVACVIYTSGSTGQPKGVQVTHRSLHNALASWTNRYFDPEPGFRWLSLTSVSFDVFTGDVFRALGSGGTLVIGDSGSLLDIEELAEVLRTQQINALECAPRFVDQLVDHLADPEIVGISGPDARSPHQSQWPPLEALRSLVVTTDVWHTAGLTRARHVLGPDVRLLTAFGLTETTVDSTASDLSAELAVGEVEGLAADLSAGRPAADGPTPIGKPLANTRVFVLDDHLAPLPVGVPGELYVGGAGLARGYGQRPALTALRFVADPFVPGERLYRTGDRARWRPDGELEFLGRLDAQLNVRGYRIEPGEIETALHTHPTIKDAVVTASRADADQRLVAYVVPADPTSALPAVGELRGWLGQTLPEHMVPGVYVELDQLPVTPNGKVDHAALPPPDRARSDLVGGFVAPRTPTEVVLAGVWAEVLDRDQVGAEDNFFDLGGHSLLATQVVSRLRTVFGIDVTLAQLFDHPTVTHLSHVIEAQILEEVEHMSEDEALEALQRESDDDAGEGAQ